MPHAVLLGVAILFFVGVVLVVAWITRDKA